MSQLHGAFTANTLLGALPDADLSLLMPSLSRVVMPRDQVLVEANQPIEHVYFMEGGIASIVSFTVDAAPTEVGIFGREGMSGTALLLGADRTPQRTFIQVDGATALRIDAEPFLAVLRQSETLHTMLLRYVQTLFVQTAQSVVANAHHRIEARLARWLLMCHDRIEGDEIPLTHEFMSMMIGAERSGVTVSLHVLEGAGMIRSLRGRVVVLDREKLIELAGAGYGPPEAEYRRMIGPIGRDRR